MSVCLLVFLFVWLSVCFQNALAIENASNVALVPSLPEMKPALAAVCSATVVVLSQSSGIERPFFAMRRGHVVYNNCALYILLYKQCRGFFYCSKRVVYVPREVCVPGTPSSYSCNNSST